VTDDVDDDDDDEEGWCGMEMNLEKRH